jgi:arylsulfatase
MNRRTFLSSATAAAATGVLRAQRTLRPNIIVVLADDMGISDAGCYGGEITTPNLDRMARRGVRFTQFYNTARCCPSRASLLTGLYPHQAGIGHMMEDRGFPAYRGDLNRRSVTIAEALRPAGYQTLMCGKWHVTPVNQSKHNWPLQRGFDRFYGTIHGAGSFFDPVTLTRDNEPVAPESESYYYTDALSDQAVRFIGDAAGKPAPFFLYLAYTSPHWPLHALEDDVAKYRGRYKRGWDSLRVERHRRMIDMGVVDKRWPMTPRDSRVPAWEDAPNKPWQERRMEVYAAQIERMDTGIGRVLAKLRELAIEDNTLVLFLCDNGGCAEELSPVPPGKRRSLHVPEKTRDGRVVREGNVPSIMPGADDTYQSFGIGWANASNTPFRLYKHWVHEGGIATPLIAQWPSRIRNGGGLRHEPGHVIDIMATCLDVAGARYPEVHAGERIQPLEGKSLLPVLDSKVRQGHTEIYWEHEGNRAVRQGRWKLVSQWQGKWELFDLVADRTEMNNLVESQAAKAEELSGKYDTWAAKCQVEPWDKVTKG